MDAAQRIENNHKWTSDLRSCYKSRRGATQKVLGNPLVIAQAFLRLVPRFRSHWKVRNKTAFSRDVTAHPVSSPRIFFVIPIPDIALIYSTITNKASDSSTSAPIQSVHCLLNVGYLNTQCWSVSAPCWCPLSHCWSSAEPSLWGQQVAWAMGAKKPSLCFKSSINGASTPCKTQQDLVP